MPLLAGCQTMTPTGAISPQAIVVVCEAWKLRTYSSRDTPETQLEVRKNNAARNAFCEEK